MPPKKIRVSISVTEGEDRGRVFSIDREKVSLGRAGDIVFRDTKVSRKHAEISIKKGSVFIKDLGSTNGVFVNDKKVEKAELKNLDEVAIGFTKFSVAILEDLKSFKEKNAPSHADSKSGGAAQDFPNIGKMIEDELSKFSRWDISIDTADERTEERRTGKALGYIEIIEGPDKGKKCKIRKGTTAIGRSKVDVALRDTDVSRSHAEIEVFSKDQIYIRDLGSTNGTYVNNKKITYARLKGGDVVQMGATVMRFTVSE